MELTYMTYSKHGERPYKVVVKTSGEVLIYDNHQKMLVRSFYPKALFIGADPENEGQDEGNSILLELTDLKYMYVGEKILRFGFPERITTYISALDMKGIPRPIAVSNNYMCYVSEGMYVPNNIVKKVVRGELGTNDPIFAFSFVECN